MYLEKDRIEKELLTTLKAVLVGWLLYATRALGVLLLAPNAVTGTVNAISKDHIVVIEAALCSILAESTERRHG